PDIIPASVKLSLFEYKGLHVTRLIEIQGKMSPVSDGNDEVLLLSMLRAAGIDQDDLRNGLIGQRNLIGIFKGFPEKWQNFKMSLGLSAAVMEELAELTALINQLKQSQFDMSDENVNQFFCALDAANVTLAGEIDQLKENGASNRKIQRSHAMA